MAATLAFDSSNLADKIVIIFSFSFNNDLNWDLSWARDLVWWWCNSLIPSSLLLFASLNVWLFSLLKILCLNKEKKERRKRKARKEIKKEGKIKNTSLSPSWATYLSSTFLISSFILLFSSSYLSKISFIFNIFN